MQGVTLLDTPDRNDSEMQTKGPLEQVQEPGKSQC